MKDLFMIIGWSEMLLTREVKKTSLLLQGGIWKVRHLEIMGQDIISPMECRLPIKVEMEKRKVDLQFYKVLISSPGYFDIIFLFILWQVQFFYTSTSL